MTLDDVELVVWRTLGARDADTVDTVLRVVQAYAEGVVEQRRTTLPTSFEPGWDVVFEGPVVIRGGGTKTAQENPHNAEGRGAIMRKEGHPPFSAEEIPETSGGNFGEEDEEFEEDYFSQLLEEVVEESMHSTGEIDPEGGGEIEKMIPCTRCKKLKAPKEFAMDRTRARGRRWKCRVCEADLRADKKRRKALENGE